MSILIHGVEKPKTCNECPFCVLSTSFDHDNMRLICNITKNVCVEYTPIGERIVVDAMEHCPIEQVEEKE